MKKTFSRCTAALGLLAGLSLAFSAHATPTWTFAGQTSGGNPVYDANGEPLAITSYSNSTASLSISGAYATNGASNAGFASGAKWQTPNPDANVLYWSGNGVGMCSDGGSGTTPSNPSCGSPNHAVDNNGTTEGILLSFSTSISLTSIGIGWNNGGDSDISLWRYVGTGVGGPAALNTTGADKASMEAAGWKLVSNYANLSVDTGEPFNLVNGAKTDGSGDPSGTSVGSSWWLITAYNSSYGAGTNLNQGDDYFKIYAVAGDKCTGTTTQCGSRRVSEPGSLALASLALFGAVYTRRRNFFGARKA